MTLTNITIDNINTTAIHYYPPLCNGTGWIQNGPFTQYAFDQTYTYCPGSFDARAVFKFTGVAVYFFAPLFQDSDSMYFHLDDRPYEEVLMKSPTGASLASRVIWSAQNLTNTDHVLELLPGLYDGGYGYVTVDAFIYTASDQNLFKNGVLVDAFSKPKINKTAIGVGVGLGTVILGLLVMGVLLFFHTQKRSGTPRQPPMTETFIPDSVDIAMPQPVHRPTLPNFHPMQPAFIEPDVTGGHDAADHEPTVPYVGGGSRPPSGSYDGTNMSQYGPPPTYRNPHEPAPAY